ncbi:sugar phosphate isomerase/epimerase family protein [Oceanobacillus jordanicus]|uniref:Sugar phosphate isomerase/epimerase n=1 Tax=Oceanobacillus jordanicus TaxID=2867266 RepID=A0AAW5B4E8_9BACI|nr:sugar phosphate isomerase/epimerase family protein [Oceanobacillus jordanicus]MCG3419394.1 sugar phosphate isomerase/epimerase [Oceanobacillus jordanicus]
MKLGMSSYSLLGAIKTGEMSILDVIQWTADQGGEHIEIVPLGFTLEDNPDLIKSIVQKAKDVGIEISNYAIGADFLKPGEGAFEQEIARVKKEVDIAHQLGVKLMRHDVSFRPANEASIKQFETDLPKLTEACQIIADYAKEYGIVTSIENHGFYVQASDRVQRLIENVERPNFKTTLDTGNFLCVDEDPLVGVKNNMEYASMVHAKDFYVRPASSYNPGEGWFQSTTGNYLRGAITGHGDINLREVLKVVKEAGYDGYLSIEFEGLEECKKASKIGLDNVRRIWQSL